MKNNTEGAKYQATKDLDRPALKKAILADVNAQMPAGVRVTLKNPHYSSFTVTVSGMPSILNPAWVKCRALDTLRGRIDENPPEFTEEARALMDKVEELVNAYNYDRSDYQSDYFNTRFYLDVHAHHGERQAEELRIHAEHSPLRAQRRALLVNALKIANNKLLEIGGLPQTTGRMRKPIKPLLKLTEAEHLGSGIYLAYGSWDFPRLVGKICGEPARVALLKALALIDAAIEECGGDWDGIDVRPKPLAYSVELQALRGEVANG